MRASVMKDDRGYNKKAVTNFVVFADGHRLKKCVMADEELGIALVHAIDNRGNVLINEDMTETVKKYVTGRIDIVENLDHIESKQIG